MLNRQSCSTFAAAPRRHAGWAGIEQAPLKHDIYAACLWNSRPNVHPGRVPRRRWMGRLNPNGNHFESLRRPGEIAPVVTREDASEAS